jgi:MGT family glycosyltransferase
MSCFLFTTMPATGHVVPKLPLARELSARGHEVHWYTGAAYREEVLATGAVHHPIRSAEDFGGQSIGEAFPELVGLTGIAMVRQALQRVFIDNAPGMLFDCQAILDEHPADAILSEPLFVAARWLHELDGPPWATLGETMLGTYSRDTAPFGPGLFPMGGPIGQLRNRAMNAIHRRILFAPVTERYEHARERVGLPRLGISFIDTFTGPYLYLQSTVPSFEYARRDDPAHLHFIGPLLPQATKGFAAPEWWSELAGRKVVLVTQGTVATDPRHLLAPTLEALADESALVVATTGGDPTAALAALGGSLPANARLERFVPYAELMPHVDTLVTNGGYGTVQHALSHGVPIVVAGATEDKPENAARVAWSGAGIRLRAQSPTPARIRDAVHRVSGESSFRTRAREIADEMACYDAPRTGADLLEALARSGKPVTSPLRGPATAPPVGRPAAAKENIDEHPSRFARQGERERDRTLGRPGPTPAPAPGRIRSLAGALARARRTHGADRLRQRRLPPRRQYLHRHDQVDEMERGQDSHDHLVDPGHIFHYGHGQAIESALPLRGPNGESGDVVMRYACRTDVAPSPLSPNRARLSGTISYGRL